MPHRRTDAIRGVLLQCGAQRLLLANASVAEMIARADVQARPSAPGWLLGDLDWHGWQVPVLSFAGLAGLDEDASAPLAGNVVVLKALAGNPRRPYLALAIDGFPHLVSVPREGLIVDASEQALPDSVHMRVLLGEYRALLPDLDALERALDALDETA